jgi:diguanylate cyclase (GGDEF)-like protein/PAS domain S-box-containing protein
MKAIMPAIESLRARIRRLSLRLESHLALIFGLLGLLLVLLIVLQWTLVLKPALRAEAESRASVLAQAQIQGVEKRLLAGLAPEQIKSELASALGDMLLLRDAFSGQPFILRIGLRLDYELYAAPPGSLDLDLGASACPACFVTRVPLYHPRDRLLVGVVTCYSNPWFYTRLIGDLGGKLAWVIGIILSLIGFAWLLTSRLLSRVRQSEANLRTVFEAAPFPMVLKADGQAELDQANEAAMRYLGLREGLSGRLSSPTWLRLVAGGDLPIDSRETREICLSSEAGKVRWALMSAQPLSFSGVRGRLITLVDVSELKATQEELRAASLTDALTGLFNRRHLYQRLASEMDLVKRYAHPLSIVIFDLDHFKKVNDTFGHRVGDEVLVRTAATLTASVREVDVAGRHGGEEFMLILPHASLAQACEVAERIRADLDAMTWPQAGLHVTISAGVSQYAGETIDAFIDVADHRLYEAKGAGRNRVYCVSAGAGP